MRNRAVVKGFLAFAMLGGVWWFWTLGSGGTFAATENILTPEDGTVEIQQGSTAWKRITTRTSVAAADRVRTAKDSHATLQFGTGAEIRFSGDTEIKMQDAEIQANGTQTMTVHLVLDHGRVWSRVLRLFDVDSEFTIAHQNVVATVRGTSFDFSGTPTGTTVWVADSAVELFTSLKSTVATSSVIAKGSLATFDGRGEVLVHVPLTNEDRQTAWFQKNTSRDAAFDERVRTQLHRDLEDLQSPEPGSFRDTLSTWSEDVHTFLGGGNTLKRIRRSATRRLDGFLRAVEQGKEGLALQGLNRAEDGWLGKMKNADPASKAEVVRALMDIQFLLQPVGPESPSYRMKQRLEDVVVELFGSDRTAATYARLLAVDARIDEADSLIQGHRLDEAQTAADAANSGVENVQKDVDHLNGTKKRITAIRSKITSVHVRLAAILAEIQAARALEAPGFETATTSSVVTSTIPIVTPTSTILGIKLMIHSPPANVGVPVTLSVLAILEDQSQTDVTNQSQLTLTPNTLGKLNGSIFIPTKPGEVVVGAQFTNGTNRFMGRAALTILGARSTSTTP